MHTPLLHRVHALVDQHELSFDREGAARHMAYDGTVGDVVDRIALGLRTDDAKTLYLNTNRLLIGLIDYSIATTTDVLRNKHIAEHLGVAVARGDLARAHDLHGKLTFDDSLRKAPVIEKPDTISWISFNPAIVEDLVCKLEGKRFDYIVLDGHDAYRPGFMIAAALGSRVCAIRNAQDSGRDPKPKPIAGERDYLARKLQNKRVLVMGEDVSTGNALSSLSDFVSVVSGPKLIRTASCLALHGHPRGIPNYFGQERDHF